MRNSLINLGNREAQAKNWSLTQSLLDRVGFHHPDLLARHRKRELEARSSGLMYLISHYLIWWPPTSHLTLRPQRELYCMFYKILSVPKFWFWNRSRHGFISTEQGKACPHSPHFEADRISSRENPLEPLGSLWSGRDLWQGGLQ